MVASLLEADVDSDISRLVSGLPPRGLALDCQPDDGDAIWFTHFDCWDDSNGEDSYEESWEWEDPKCQQLMKELLQDATQITGDKRFNELLSEWPATDRESVFNKIEALFVQNGYDVYTSDTMCEVYPHEENRICPECGEETHSVLDLKSNTFQKVCGCESRPVAESEEDGDPKAYLNQLDSVYYYYDVHIGEGGESSDGWSCWLKSTVKPEEADGDGFIPWRSPAWDLLVREAVQKYTMSRRDVEAIDYICNVTEGEYMDMHGELGAVIENEQDATSEDVQRLIGTVPEVPPGDTLEMLNYWRENPDLYVDLDYVGAEGEGKTVTLCDEDDTPMANFSFDSPEACNAAVDYCLARLNPVKEAVDDPELRNVIASMQSRAELRALSVEKGEASDNDYLEQALQELSESMYIWMASSPPDDNIFKLVGELTEWPNNPTREQAIKFHRLQNWVVAVSNWARAESYGGLNRNNIVPMSPINPKLWAASQVCVAIAYVIMIIKQSAKLIPSGSAASYYKRVHKILRKARAYYDSNCAVTEGLDDETNPEDYIKNTYDLQDFIKREGFEQATNVIDGKQTTTFYKCIGPMLYFDVGTRNSKNPGCVDYAFVSGRWELKSGRSFELEEGYVTICAAYDQPMANMLAAYKRAKDAASRVKRTFGESLENMSPEEIKRRITELPQAVSSEIDWQSDDCRECKQVGAAPEGDRPFSSDNLCWDCYRHMQSTGDLPESIEDPEVKRLADQLPEPVLCPECDAPGLRVPTAGEMRGIQFDLGCNREDRVDDSTIRVCDTCGYLQYENLPDEEEPVAESEEPDPKSYIDQLPQREDSCNECGKPMRRPTESELIRILATAPRGSIDKNGVLVCDRCDTSLIPYCLPESDEPDPKQYIDALPARFDYDEVLGRIQMECSYCMDDKEDKKAFLKWIKAHEHLFPDVNRALKVIKNNESWCTDNTLDMTLFFEQLGFKPEDATCPRCGGNGEEPGAPVEDDGVLALCSECNGSGTRVIDCECDNTHQAQDTVCSWCWARGRRHWNDPAV